METILKMAMALENTLNHQKLTRLDTQYYYKDDNYVGFATYTVYDIMGKPLTYLHYEIHVDGTVTKTRD